MAGSCLAGSERRMMRVSSAPARPLAVGLAQPVFALKRSAWLLEVARDGGSCCSSRRCAPQSARSSSTRDHQFPATMNGRSMRLQGRGALAAPGPRWSARCGRRRKYAPPAFRY